ncbi:Dyp-type peroxidase [Agromyces aureus]|uniref:Peroxidase n=1 Tax=Agromyces aureus TaxID=453304 RepID=A0A191WGB4_9MICO|nr:Dyp-type peroxidase [Agromyces aureus]ANJ27335.1 peroxidase [Agromyces aureus]
MASNAGKNPNDLSRRQLFLGGAVAGVGAVAAVAADHALNAAPMAPGAAAPLNGTVTIPFHGAHQSGIDSPPTAHATFIALDLREGIGREELQAMMRLLSDDAARLAQGVNPLADTEPELSLVPARLTITFGFGPRLVDRAGTDRAPRSWLRPLPAFKVDRLEQAWSDGDLLLQVSSDDPLTVAHATRMLLKDARRFATVRWTQKGFRRAHGSEATGTTMRNLFGQIDGTTNPKLGTADLESVVWIDDKSWLAGGTSMVMRRIDMNVDKWDRLDRPGRELAVGRRLDNGAPLTGTREQDEPDFNHTTTVGFPTIPEFSHIRRARSDATHERIFRRSYNYDDAPSDPSMISNTGLVFISFQADIDTQFVPIQRRLDDLDLLNEWTTPVGSAVFAIPPGCEKGGYIGETLLA